VLAEVELERNRPKLIAEAEQTIGVRSLAIALFKYRKTNAQTQKPTNINDFGCSDVRCKMVVGYASS